MYFFTDWNTKKIIKLVSFTYVELDVEIKSWTCGEERSEKE